jgi:hypothetical protein
MRRQWFAVLVAVPLLLLGLAACGGGSGDSSSGASDTSSSEDPQDQAVKFAQCMRDHGVDMPDPETDDKGRVRLRVGSGEKVDKDKVDAAMEACKKYNPIGDSGRLNDLQNDPKFQEAQLRWAQCMRDHGVDVPDPGSGEHGNGLVIGQGQNKGKVQAAMDACDPILRDFFGDSGPAKSGGSA